VIDEIRYADNRGVFVAYQVLGHLIENAVKYSPTGSTVFVAARRDADDVVIDVTDQGVGIPDDIDVFAPFQRGDTDTEGAGLGLYIVREIVRAHGGCVEARSTDSEGTTFVVTLPRRVPEPSASSTPRPPDLQRAV